MTSLAEGLKKFGLNPTEGKILITLMEVGQSGAAAIARKLSIPRATVYAALDNLRLKGLVAEEAGRRPTQFAANHPSVFRRIIATRQQELTLLEDAAKKLEEILAPHFRSESAHVPKLKFFEGGKNVESMLEDMLPEWERSMIGKDKTLWGCQDHSFVAQYGKWLKIHWKRNLERGLSVKLLSNDVELERSLRGKIAGREVRSIPVVFEFHSTMWVCGEYIILLMTYRKPHYAFQLRDDLLSSNLRDLFRFFWQMKQPTL